MYVVTVYIIIPSLINPIQTNSGIDCDGLSIDFFDIPMDGIQEADELDEYLGQAIENVKDPIAWWWNRQKVYPQFLEMVLDYLSIPGKSQFISIFYCPNIVL